MAIQTVLHLEDDAALCKLMQEVIEMAETPVELKQFSNSDKALDYIQNSGELVDIFILDIRVPGSMDGLEVAKKIRKLNFTAPVIVSSAYRLADRKSLKDLSCEWAPKPWNILDVLTRLKQLSTSDVDSTSHNTVE